MAVKDFTQTGSDTITGQTVSDGGDFDGKNVGMSVIRFGGVSAAVPADLGNGATGNGTLRVTISSDSTGVLSVDDNGSAITVDNAGTFACQIDGAALTALQLIDDPVGTIGSTAPTKGFLLAGSDGTNTRAVKTDSTGQLYLADDSPGIIATVAHDAADSGDPLKVGSKSVSSLSAQTPVQANDRSNVFSDLDGVVFARSYSLADIVTGTASCTDGASTECIAAQSAGIKTYLSKVVLTNSSAEAALVEIKDGTTVKATLSVPANKLSTSFTFDPPIPGTAATAWNFDPDAALSTIYCTMVGFKSKV